MTDQIKIMIEGLADFLDVVKNGKDITTEQFATNLLSKLNKLDRKKVERKVNYWMAHYSPDVDWLIESILSLVPEQPKLDRERVEEIFDKLGTGEDDDLSAKDFSNTITAILSLAIPQPKFATEQEIRGIFLKYSIVREFELKDSSKVGYRVIGIEEGEAMITELSKLSIDRNRMENDIYEGVKKEKLQYVKTDRDKYYMAKRLADQICKQTGGK